MLGLAVIVIAGIAFLKFRQIQAGIAKGAAFAQMPPAAVTTTVVKTQTWQPVLSAIGSLKAVNGVTISTDMAGIVSQIGFESGAAVKKGQLLLTMDTQQEEAQLHSAEAKRDLAKLTLERNRELVAKKAVSSSEFDNAQGQFRDADAAVEQAKAVIARKRIVAPFDGVLGIRMVNAGQYLNTGMGIVPLQSLDPIYVEFALPQQQLATVEVGKKLRLMTTGVVGETFEAEISAIDSQVDESTRNIMVQGTAHNPERKLRPGMFVNVEVLLAEKGDVVAIPSSSISFAPYGDSVYVLKNRADGKPGQEVQQQFVKLGPTRGDQVSILSGLKEGDEIVTSGVFKLHSGSAVRVDNSVQPSNELNPKPADT
ncbi:MAG: Efflux transporter, family, subunit [Chthoniobacteraceae bacterium]|nr:Efflux transporter, family, subunit [Chthoniobacteraceae bacterium]